MPGTVLGLEMSRTWPFFVWRGVGAKDWLIKNNYSSGSCSQEALESLLLPRAAAVRGSCQEVSGQSRRWDRLQFRNPGARRFLP